MSLFLQEGDVPIANVHPVVALSVLDHFMRRPAEASMAIGVLLGRKHANVVEVMSSFAVPHEEGEGPEVGIDEQYLREMLDLQKHIKGDKEQIIGWYCSCASDLFSLKTPHVHDFIQGITAELGIQPIYLAVDAGLSDMSVGTRAYYGTALELGGEALSAQFKEIRTNIVVEESEKVGLDAMIKQMGKARESSTVAKDIGNVEVSIRRLLGLLDVTAEYVSDVVSGKVEPNDNIGREISLALSSVPRIDPESFGKAFNENLQDLLMVVYLGNLTRAQLAISDKMSLCDQI